MAHRTLTNEDEVAAYVRYLDDGYPARTDVITHVCDRLADDGVPSSNGQKPRVLELACGPGVLAEAILNRQRVSEYVGVDITQASLDYAKARVERLGSPTMWLRADLNENEWLDAIDGRFDAAVSMQSLHDLGGIAEIERILGIANHLLLPGGRLIYADLLRTPNDAADANPGRFTVPRHLELLADAGFTGASCTTVLDDFGCFEATRASG